MAIEKISKNTMILTLLIFIVAFWLYVKKKKGKKEG
jgi:hypothetical protein